ncbi:hypothetical protein ACHAPQ_012481, partial [Fusarium lateritium]
QRLKGKDGAMDKQLPSSGVRRWRVDEVDSVSSQDTDAEVTTICISHTPCHAVPSTTEQVLSSLPETGLDQVIETGSASQPLDFNFPLPSDQLLHLIQYNVFRAFISIKRTLKTVSSDPTTCPVYGPCLDDTMRCPLNPSIPPSLAPTSLQSTRYHFPWINIFPFPRMRDNFIRREGHFDKWELWQDLVGDLMGSNTAPWQRGTPAGVSAPVVGLKHLQMSSLGKFIDTDEVTAGRSGLIIWGEPHDMQSWEATPGFLAKWSWAVEGCHHL